MSVYQKVRAYIDDNGLKQVAIAAKAGIPVATFNAILNGKRTLVRRGFESYLLGVRCQS